MLEPIPRKLLITHEYLSACYTRLIHRASNATYQYKCGTPTRKSRDYYTSIMKVKAHLHSTISRQSWESTENAHEEALGHGEGSREQLKSTQLKSKRSSCQHAGFDRGSTLRTRAIILIEVLGHSLRLLKASCDAGTLELVLESLRCQENACLVNTIHNRKGYFCEIYGSEMSFELNKSIIVILVPWTDLSLELSKWIAYRGAWIRDKNY